MIVIIMMMIIIILIFIIIIKGIEQRTFHKLALLLLQLLPKVRVLKKTPRKVTRQSYCTFARAI